MIIGKLTLNYFTIMTSNHLKSMKKVILLFFIGTLAAQYPADSLYRAPNTTLLKKIFLYPIAKWQQFSYNQPSLNCQFEPSCSNYGAQAIHSHGAMAGLFMTSDRIIRCNPNARQYHQFMDGQFHLDGRLMDPVSNPSDRATTKSPIIAAGLSMIIPGLGRVYSGRTSDGIYGFVITALAINNGVNSIKKESILAPFQIGLAMTLYGGEIYGAYRTAKYYQPIPIKD